MTGYGGGAHRGGTERGEERKERESNAERDAERCVEARLVSCCASGRPRKVERKITSGSTSHSRFALLIIGCWVRFTTTQNTSGFPCNFRALVFLVDHLCSRPGHIHVTYSM